MKNIKISYFAIFKEQCGLDHEEFETEAKSLSELYLELKKNYGFTLNQQDVTVAINDQLNDWQASFNDEDHIVFIPPVSGG